MVAMGATSRFCLRMASMNLRLGAVRTLPRAHAHTSHQNGQHHDALQNAECRVQVDLGPLG